MNYLIAKNKATMNHHSSSLLPSGKHTKNYGKSPNHHFLTGKLTISTGPCSSSQTVSHYQGVTLCQSDESMGVINPWPRDTNNHRRIGKNYSMKKMDQFTFFILKRSLLFYIAV